MLRRLAHFASLAAVACLIALSTGDVLAQLPRIDDAKLSAARIRKLAGKHILLYTDLPAQADIDELPRVFDAAVPLWSRYFGLDPASTEQWQVAGCLMQDKERFVTAGLYSPNLPPFPNGYSRGSQLWLYDQPSAYYRRHLLLHEGTHSFMQRWLGGAGPPWYMEGIAELLATHGWQAGQLQLAIMPRTKEEVPFWGRIKIVKDEMAAGRGMTLAEIMQYDARAHVRNEPYGWCWAATAFLDQHPITQAAFRNLKTQTKLNDAAFSKRFTDTLNDHWPNLNEEWQLFLSECDYGYEVARAAVVRKPTADLPAGGATIQVAADRGWQSAGYRLEAGKKYTLTATGRYQIASEPRPWPCEAGGVTIRYHRGQPLGKLMFAISDIQTQPPAQTPLADPAPIGLSRELIPALAGTLYLKINEPASGLAENTGSLSVRIEPAR